MTALADLLAQAADIARKEGHLWLVSRIGADMVALDAAQRAKDGEQLECCGIPICAVHHLCVFDHEVDPACKAEPMVVTNAG